jgi:hypothetical protein
MLFNKITNKGIQEEKIMRKTQRLWVKILKQLCLAQRVYTKQNFPISKNIFGFLSKT